MYDSACPYDSLVGNFTEIFLSKIETFSNIFLSKIETIAQLVVFQISDQKLAGPWFDSRIGNSSFCLWGRHLMQISHWSLAVHPLWWSNLMKDLRTKPKKGCSPLVLLEKYKVLGLYE